MKTKLALTFMSLLFFATVVFALSRETEKSLDISGGYAGINSEGAQHRGAIISVSYHNTLGRRSALVVRYTSLLSNEDPYTELVGYPSPVLFVYPHRYFQAGQMTLDVLLNYSLLRISRQD